METLLTGLIESFINSFNQGTSATRGVIADSFNWTSKELLNTVFDIPSQLGDIGGVMNRFDDIIIALAISLIIIKFVMKGFNTYVLWIDENADSDPFNTLINLGKALIITFCFGTLYTMIVDVAISFGTQLLDVITDATKLEIAGDGSVILLILEDAAGSIFYLIGVLVYVILYIVLYFKLLMMGFQLWLLRIGVPLACIGIIDSSQELWKNFLMKFWQISLGAVIQIVLMYFSMMLAFSHHPIFSIVALIGAITTPSMLREFMYTSGNISMNALLHNSQILGRAITSLTHRVRR